MLTGDRDDVVDHAAGKGKAEADRVKTQHVLPRRRSSGTPQPQRPSRQHQVACVQQLPQVDVVELRSAVGHGDRISVLRRGRKVGALGPEDFRVFALPYLAEAVHLAKGAGAPVIAFAPADPANPSGELRCSGRSIAGLHLRDALDRLRGAVADALATGCLAALLHNRLSDSKFFVRLTEWPAIPIGGLLIGLGYGAALLWRPAAYVVGQTAANIGILLIIQHVVRHPEGWSCRLLNARPFVAVGVLSYSLYLWQEPFLFFLPHTWPTSFPQNLVLAFAAAIASYFIVEKPILRLKDRLTAATPRTPPSQ